MPAPFVRFGPAHLGALALIAAAACTLVVVFRRAPPAAARRLRLALAATIVLGAASEFAGAALEGWLTVREAAPLQLCDLNLALAVVALVTLSRRTLEPLYFFALSGTLPALVTPELPAGFPAFRFLIYFALHGLTVATTLALTAGLRLVPARGAWRRAILWLNLYAALIGLVNVALDANFMYLCAKPTEPTPFDWLGPWPWYILSLEAVCATLFFLLDLPLRRVRSSS